MPDQPHQSLADGYVKWLREQVGSQLIYLVYASTVVFDAEGRILVQTRYDFDWLSVPGGAMELGESLAETARREVLEETGIEVAIKGLAGVLTHPRYNLHYPNGDDVQQWTAVFWGEVAGGEMRPDGGETLGVMFMEPAEFMEKGHPAHREMVRMVQQVRAGGPAEIEPVESFPPLQDYYPILRQHVGQAPVILPGAMAVIEDEQGRILMTFRGDYHYWDYPAGLADLGETSTANIVREVEEETGLIVEPYALVALYSEPRWWYGPHPNGDVSQEVGVVFACRVVGGVLNREGADNENTAVDWLPVEQVLAQTRFEATPQIMRDYLDRANWPHIR